MKPPHIILALLVIALVLYLALIQDTNRSGINLPFPRATLPIGWVLGFLITFSWLIGWVPSKVSLWRKEKEI